MKNIKLLKAVVIILIGFLLSCTKMDDPTVETNPTYPVSGEWWVTYKLNDGTDLGGGYTKMLTYNTSANTTDSIWVTDITGDQANGFGNFWTYKVKVALDMANKSFAANQRRSAAIVNDTVPYPILVNIASGKVILKGGKTKGGNVSDSIYLVLQLEDSDQPPLNLAPYESIIVSGVRRTGFQEDEY